MIGKSILFRQRGLNELKSELFRCLMEALAIAHLDFFLTTSRINLK